jgi:osmotically-inducible protein OsmY
MQNIFLIFLIVIETTLSGCAALLPISVAGTAAFVSDERSLGKIIDDKLIYTNITSELSKKGGGQMFMAVNVTVLEGRVLLTGNVGSKTHIDEAVKTAWSVHGVKEVINCLLVNMKPIGNSANDILIEKAIESRLLLEKKLMSTNYKVIVNNNEAYILGIAQSEEEMNKVLHIASNSKGVSKVVNYIILKNDIRRG